MKAADDDPIELVISRQHFAEHSLHADIGHLDFERLGDQWEALEYLFQRGDARTLATVGVALAVHL